MDCRLCTDELDAFLEGTLTEKRRLRVQEHLDTCEECLRNYRAMQMAYEVMLKEKTLAPNPYLSTRIMAALNEEPVTLEIPVYRKVLRTSVIGMAVAASVVIGILAGNIYKPFPKVNLPEEMIYMNDALLESVNAFSE